MSEWIHLPKVTRHDGSSIILCCPPCAFCLLQLMRPYPCFYPLSILNMTQGACQSHNTPVCSRGKKHMRGSHGKPWHLFFCPLVEINSFQTPYIKLIFHPEERPQIFQNRERNFQGYATQVYKQKRGPIKLPSMWYSHSVATCGEDSNILLARKSIIIRMLPVTYIEYLPYTGSFI